MKSFKTYGLVALLFFLPASGWAKSKKPRPPVKKYFRLSGLAFQKRDSDIGFKPDANTVVSSIVDRDLSFEQGYGFSIAYGFQSHFNLNTELELSGRWSSLDQLNSPAGQFSTQGDLQSFTFMLNIPWQFRNRTSWTPYVGAGVGMAWQKGEISALPDGSAVASTGEELTFAYQILAGVGYALTPQWELILGYRFFGTIDAQLGTLQLENRSHNVEVGVRWYLPEKRKVKKKRSHKRPRKKAKRSRYKKERARR